MLSDVVINIFVYFLLFFRNYYYWKKNTILCTVYCNLQQQFSINLELFIVEDCHLLQEKILLREPRLFVLYHNGVSILINICQSIKLSHSDIVFPYLCISGFLVVSKYFRHTTVPSITTAVCVVSIYFICQWYYYLYYY